MKYGYAALAFLGGFLAVLFCYWIDTALAPPPFQPQVEPKVQTKVVYVEVPVEKEPEKPQEDTEMYKEIKQLFDILNHPKENLYYNDEPFRPYYLRYINHPQMPTRMYTTYFYSETNQIAFSQLYARLTYAPKIDIYLATPMSVQHFSSFEKLLEQYPRYFWWIHNTLAVSGPAIDIPVFFKFTHGAYLWFILSQEVTVHWAAINANWYIEYSIQDNAPLYITREQIKALLQYEIDTWLSDMIYRLALEGFYHFMGAFFLDSMDLAGYVLVCADKNVQHLVVLAEYESFVLGEGLKGPYPRFYVHDPIKKGV
ncbi:MAG: hypothetical protein J7L51_03975 [Desulfurococcales archaeon]|nr:hypothetical protein [Desulfurococcales archaeon]